MKILITGGAGFVGSNLAKHALDANFDVCIVDNLSRVGSSQNIEWLEAVYDLNFSRVDIRDDGKINSIIKSLQPDYIFHLAGQVAMTSSLINPREDFEINALGTLNILEAVRNYSVNSKIIYSSTNKVYGDLEGYSYTELDSRYSCNEHPLGFDENIPLCFSSPYGCSKGTADQYVLDYSKMYGLRTVVLRHSSMFGGRQFATSDQGWIGWFCEQAVLTTSNKDHRFTISGNGKQVRDVLHIEDMIKLYFSFLENDIPLTRNDFNIGGTIKNSLSLIELLNFLQESLDVKLNYDQLENRKSDQKFFVANTKKIEKVVNWKPLENVDDRLRDMIDWTKYIMENKS